MYSFLHYYTPFESCFSCMFTYIYSLLLNY
nr:MAG TPA: hypothetical protein [Caudoviricetes sp.]